MDRRVTRLESHLLIRLVVRRVGRSRSVPRSDQRDQVGCVAGPPPGLGGFDEFERHGDPAALEPGPLVTRVRSRTVAKRWTRSGWSSSTGWVTIRGMWLA